jgi:hypothetical protein
MSARGVPSNAGECGGVPSTGHEAELIPCDVADGFCALSDAFAA